ncbi:MAG: transglycosylase SLT domain-containing protein [Candidatus Magasanikbacteria bacterium]|nr:transglycosylase SLT domain-containing protein [Candidatus Magasanikbacteria bacterium]
MMSVFSIEGAGRQASKNRFQLGPDTARSLGLAVGTAEEEASSPADERTHLEKSAHAAARYLKRLHHAFGNQWGLALSAYNAGADRLTHLIVHYFKNARAVRTGHGPYFAQEYLERLGVNSATLYEKERACLMARDTKRDKKIRFALRPLWYPFAAEALGAHGWRLLEKQQKEKIVARKER